jgi:hypothetical protein
MQKRRWMAAGWFFLYCAAEVTELARRLDRAADAGSKADRGDRGLTHDQRLARIPDRARLATLNAGRRLSQCSTRTQKSRRRSLHPRVQRVP